MRDDPRRHGKVLAEQRKAETVDRLAHVADRLRALKAEGLTMQAIADWLSGEGNVPRSGPWQPGNGHRAYRGA